MIKRADSRDWYEGPLFTYKASSKMLAVKVTGSSWLIRGVPKAAAVIKVLRQFKELPGRTVLDFGAGSWLRYTTRIRRLLPTRELYVVEYEAAFHGEAAALRGTLQSDVTFWQPIEFAGRRKPHFDLILLINVLNTVSEEPHRRAIFKALADRLNPRGRLLLYQRVWTKSEKPPDALDYADGWLVPQDSGYFTYRASDGALWFNAQAKAAGLNSVHTVPLSSANTLLRLWEKPF